MNLTRDTKGCEPIDAALSVGIVVLVIYLTIKNPNNSEADE